MSALGFAVVPIADAPRGEWITRAACAQRDEDGVRVYDPREWDGKPGGLNGRDPFREARRVCLRVCPVRDECLEDALTFGDVSQMRAGYEPTALEGIARAAGVRGIKSRRRLAS